jgi:DNA-binding PadR family transcriptional regulator
MRRADPGLLVLVSLLEGPRHGYGMSDDIEVLTGDRPGPGTLYGAISRLERQGLIAPVEGGGGRRKPYTLTESGVAEVRRQLEAIEAVTGAARRRLGAQPA